MCKEMPVIPVNRVVDKKRIIRKRRAKEGERLLAKKVHHTDYNYTDVDDF
jgi:hypothetical protein